jgi:aminomethyltransferase
MQRTPLHPEHVAAGATLVDFAGWEMPVAYGSTVAEVDAVRNRAGAFDASHMGEFRITGPEAARFLQYAATNDIERVVLGREQYSLLLNEEGGVIDDVIIRRHGENEFLVVVNAGCLEKDRAWLLQLIEPFDAHLVDESPATALIAVQGPDARSIVSGLAGSASVEEIPRFGFASACVAGADCVVSRTGYTGEDGFELFCAAADAAALWRAVTAAGAAPAGLGARDVLRLEAAYPLYGHELDEEHVPAESGVSWVVAMDKPFVGREALLLREPSEALVGLRMVERAIPRQGCPVLDSSGSGAGIVTSGTFSPTLAAGIALARVQTRAAAAGTVVAVDIRGRQAPAQVVKVPFYVRSIRRTKERHAADD